ncbi:hypothetical protein MNBD_GAMMA13-1060, partial [hydrothermal vent metagenome]
MATLAEKWYSDGQEKGLEKGLEKGREEGREEGERNLFKQIIQRRYDVDVLPAWAEQAVNAASKAQIESWTRKSFD